MTKRTFLLGLFILLTISLVFGLGGWYSLRSHEIEAQAKVEATRLQQDGATVRTKERWSWVNRVPGLKEKKE